LGYDGEKEYPMHFFIDDFEGHLVLHQRVMYNTLKAYIIDVKQFASFARKSGVDGIADVTQARFDDFTRQLQRQIISTKSAMRKYAAIKAYVSYCIKYKQCADLALITFPDINPHIPFYASPPETPLHDTSHPYAMRNQLIALLAYHTPLQLTDIQKLTMKNIDTTQREICIVKNRYQKPYKIPPRINRQLEAYVTTIRPHVLHASQCETDLLFWTASGAASCMLSKSALNQIIKNQIIKKQCSKNTRKTMYTDVFKSSGKSIRDREKALMDIYQNAHSRT
jgi:site-specific recombinase XerD